MEKSETVESVANEPTVLIEEGREIQKGGVIKEKEIAQTTSKESLLPTAQLVDPSGRKLEAAIIVVTDTRAENKGDGGKEGKGDIVVKGG